MSMVKLIVRHREKCSVHSARQDRHRLAISRDWARKQWRSQALPSAPPCQCDGFCRDREVASTPVSSLTAVCGWADWHHLRLRV